MSIQIWAKESPSKVYSNLSPVLKNSSDVTVQAASDFSMPESTKLVLALGNDALEFLRGQGIIPKNRTIGSLRGVQYAYKGVPVLISYSSDIKDIDHGLYTDLLTDMAMAIRLYKTGSMLPQYGAYRYVEDFSEAVAGIKAKFAEAQKPVDTALDLETRGLDPFAVATMKVPGGYIVTIQIAWEKGKCDVVRFECAEEEEFKLGSGPLREQMQWIMNSPEVSLRGANLKYDLVWLFVRAVLEASSFKFDTTLVGCLLDENRSNGLDVHTKIYLPELGGYSDEFDRTVDKSRMDLISPEKLLPYAGGDGHATLGVSEVLKKELLADPKLTAFYVNILHPASRALEKVERGGVCVDLNEYKTLAADLDVEIDGIIKKAKSIMGGLLVAKHYDSTKFGGINLTKASLLADFMFSPKGLNLKPKMFTAKADKYGEKKPSTAMEHLQMFADDKNAAPFVALLDEYSGATKVRGTYVGELGQSGFLEYIRSDGRFHPTYWMFAGDKSNDEGGTVTGRLSCKDPAFQTIPKHHKWAKRIRRCFISPDGHVTMERDYSQGELRVIACIANEGNMIKTYQQGQDLHTRTAAGVAGHTYEELAAMEETNKEYFEATRQKGKAGNFGMVFGMQAAGFVVYARRNYGVVMTEEEAAKFRNGFFAEYPALLTYHTEYKDFAKRYGYVRGPLGRIRHLPLIKSPMREYQSKAERQAINSPVQGTLSDMLLWSLALEDAAGLTKPCPCFAIVHDAAYCYVPADNPEEWAKKHLDIQQNLPFERVGWRPQLNFPADAKIGPNMAELTKVKLK